MSVIKITYLALGQCNVVHEPSGSTIQTDLPTEYGGLGNSFSATDLLAAALGVCIATNIDKVAERHGIPLSGLNIRVKKEMSDKPKQISRLQVLIEADVKISENIKHRIERAAQACLVHRSLHPKLNVNIKLVTK